MKTADADETRRRKARELRYRKPVARDIHFDMIRQELWDIMEECDYVRYCFEDDGDSLVNALDGDGKEAYEFKRIGRYESRDKVSHDYCSGMRKQYESWHLVWGIVINPGFYVQKILKEKRMGCCRRPASSFSFVQIENMGMPLGIMGERHLCKFCNGY